MSGVRMSKPIQDMVCDEKVEKSDLKYLEQNVNNFSDELNKISKRLNELTDSLRIAPCDMESPETAERICMNKIEKISNSVIYLNDKLEFINSNIDFLEGVLK